MKHAYLILAHHEFEILKSLIKALDDERNDIYIHFDKELQTLPKLSSEHAKLISVNNRIDVRWGDVTVVEAEYSLFEAASKNGYYAYYHLLSGVDMPIKSQDDIHDFFFQHKGKEFIGFHQEDMLVEIDRKVCRYHLFPKHFRELDNPIGRFRRIARAIFLRIQYFFGFKRNQAINFKKGTQWVSLTHEFVAYILAQKENIMKVYHHTFCADEIFIQTICWSSPFREKIFDLHDEGRGCMRMIGWEGNKLVDWEDKDFDILMNSEALFARKFNSKHIDVVDRILNKISDV